jgi:putative FmdB family regulatory protein
MPIYEYTCADAHTSDVIRSLATRDEPVACLTCGAPTTRREVSASHVPPDGVYSYSPNVGDPERFERQRDAIKRGVKVIERGNTTMERAERERQGNQALERRRR